MDRNLHDYCAQYNYQIADVAAASVLIGLRSKKKKIDLDFSLL